MAKLTPKQKAFADYYIETGNASEAARRAGYSEKTAHRIGQENMQKPAILGYIDGRMKEIASERILGATEALEILTSIARGEATEEIITPTGKAIEKRADINQRQKAIDSLMKRFNVLASLAKTEAEAEYIKEKTKLLKGAAKDTSLLNALIDVVNGDD
ncbi:terminase small subunit [Salinithrix halophila]|uniref:Terminase small subunit n=1 Tax=Salinithrix halophila TaxID=1485204 RepID=A0ABV8JBV0_9BACL